MHTKLNISCWILIIFPLCLFLVWSLPASTVVQISGGCFHSLALKSDGTVWAWGLNIHGQLGDGTNTDRKNAGTGKEYRQCCSNRRRRVAQYCIEIRRHGLGMGRQLGRTTWRRHNKEQEHACSGVWSWWHDGNRRKRTTQSRPEVGWNCLRLGAKHIWTNGGRDCYR